MFVVTNMHCADCAALIDETLRALRGVRTAHATTSTGIVDVGLVPESADPATVARAITELGFRLKVPRADEYARGEPGRPQVSDAVWLALEPVLRQRGKRARELRRVFEGIAYKHRENVPWREVPAVFGPWQTLYATHTRWRTDGTWTTVAAAVGRDPEGELAWLERVIRTT